MNHEQEIAGMIDHSLLHPTMTDEDLINGCRIARDYQTASVCIKPYAVKTAVELLQGSKVAVCTVIGFPHGGNTIDVKKFETEQAIREGATEIDMVVNIGKVLSEDWDYIDRELAAISEITKKHHAILKVIFENDFLPEDNFKIKLCELCSKHKVEYVKTSTGYGYTKGADGKYSYQGATIYDLKLMRKHSAAEVKIKAAGGVRTYEDALAVRKLGVSRIGATATEAIVAGARGEKSNGKESSGY